MSEDDKKNTDDVENSEQSADDGVEIIDVPEDDSLEFVEQDVNDSKIEVAPKGLGIGSLIIAALMGGVASIALIGGVGYYLVTSNGLGGFNGDDAAAVAEQRYAELSTRVLSLEGEIIEMQDIAPIAVDLAPIVSQITMLEESVTAQNLAFEASVNEIAESQVTLRETYDSLANVTANKDGSGAVDTAAIAALQNAVALENKAQDKITGEIEAKIATLEAELTVVKTLAENAVSAGGNVEGADASNMASALAVAALERALQDEAPFEVELNVIKAFAGENAALSQLSEYATQGLASEVTLLGQFNDLLDAALVADLKGDGKSILDKFIGNAKAVISVRKTGNVAGDNAEAVLARMEVAVQAKDLGSAIDIGQALTGPAKTVFANWMAAAQSRIAAQDLMRQVSADILTSLQ